MVSDEKSEKGSVKPVLLVLLILGLGAACYYFFYVSKTPKLIGGDRDEHGCLPAAGYTWCEPKQKCLRTWEEPCTEEDEEGDSTAESPAPPIPPPPTLPPPAEPSDQPALPAANWETYTNQTYSYSFDHPADCLSGPLPGYCKQDPPEDRPPECWCFVNGENPDNVVMQAYLGDDLSLATFSVSHYSTEPYNLPEGTELVAWLQEQFSYQDIPDAANFEVDGTPAVKVYTPGGHGVYSQENIYFLRGDKLFNISMVDIDNAELEEFYDQVVATFVD